MALKRGDKAPEILGVDQAGKEIRLSDFAGSKLILYFYPKDNTQGLRETVLQPYPSCSPTSGASV